MAKKEIDFVIKVNNQQIDLSKKSFKEFDVIIKQAKKSLQELPLSDPRYKVLNKEIKAAEVAWKETTKAASQFGDEMDNGDPKIKSYKAQIMEATKELIKLEQQFGKTSQQYLDQQNKIKNLRDEVEAFQRGTLKLDDALGNLPGPIGRVGQAMQQTEIITQSAKSAFTSLIETFPLLKNAWVATGFGAIIVLIGTLVAAVMDAAKSFKPLQNAFAQLKDSVGAIFNALKPVTDFLLNVFVGVLKVVAGTINLVAKAFGGMSNGAAEASLELERSIKKQESLLNNYGQALDSKLKEYISAYKEFNEKKKKILDDDYQNEVDRQGDLKILQLGYINFLKTNIAEREKIYQQFNTDVLKTDKEVQVKRTDNQRQADRLSTQLQKDYIGETSRNEMNYQKAKMKALKEDEVELRKLNTENAKITLQANIDSQKLLQIEMIKLETKGFQEFLLLQEEQDKKNREYARKDVAVEKERYLQILELKTSLIKEDNARNLQAAKDNLLKLKEDHRLELEEANLQGISLKNLKKKQDAEDKLAKEQVRKAQVQVDAYNFQLKINEEQRNFREELTKSTDYYQRRRDVATIELDKDFKLADGNRDLEEEARTKHWEAILAIDREELGNIRSNLELEYDGMYQVSADAYSKLRDIENARFEEQKRGNEQNYEFMEALAKQHAKNLNMIDVQELDTMASLLERRSETEKKLYGQMFRDLEEAENTSYAARVKAAGDNVELLEIIEREHVKRIKDLQNEKILAYTGVATAMMDSFANVTNSLAAFYEFESTNTKKSIEERKAAFEQNKKYQIATAALSAASGIIQILAQPSTLPSPFDWIVKIANAAALGIMTGVQISKIKATEFNAGNTGSLTGGNNYGRNYGDGGMIEGPLHAQGGVPLTAEGGEAIMTRGAVSMFGPMLSMLNQAGGGTSFSKGAMGQAGYDNPKSTGSNLTQPQIIKTYVVSNELTSEAQKQERLKSLSTL